jgi:hypothetical protein
MKNIILVFFFCTLCFKINAYIDEDFTLRNNNNLSISYTVHTLIVLPQYRAINTPENNNNRHLYKQYFIADQNDDTKLLTALTKLQPAIIELRPV